MLKQELTREYLEDKIAKAQTAIAFAVPGADISYAKATLAFAEARLAKLANLDFGAAQ